MKIPNQFYRLWVSAFSTLIFFSCSSYQVKDGPMTTSEYNKRPELSQALFGPNDILSESNIQKVLTSKIVLPKTLNIAVIRLSDANDSYNFQTLDQITVDQFYEKKNWGPRVQSITPVPQVMLPKPLTFASLRQAAALLQADALVVVKPASYSDWQFKWFEKNKGKGVTTLEVLLVDTRTSVVPFTAIITETAEVIKADGDYSDYELILKAKKQSEAKAMSQVATSVQKFLNQVK